MSRVFIPQDEEDGEIGHCVKHVTKFSTIKLAIVLIKYYYLGTLR